MDSSLRGVHCNQCDHDIGPEGLDFHRGACLAMMRHLDGLLLDPARDLIWSALMLAKTMASAKGNDDRGIYAARVELMEGALGFARSAGWKSPAQVAGLMKGRGGTGSDFRPRTMLAPTVSA